MYICMPHTYIHIGITICIYVCVYVCVYIYIYNNLLTIGISYTRTHAPPCVPGDRGLLNKDKLNHRTNNN